MFAAALPALATAIVENLFDSDTVAQFINLGLGIVMGGVDIETKQKALNEQIQRFVDEKRNPTADEWAELMGRSDAAHHRIQSATPGE